MRNKIQEIKAARAAARAKEEVIEHDEVIVDIPRTLEEKETSKVQTN
jgi:soluble cytochrome b562